MRKWPDNFVNKIICGDCLEVMKEMPDKCIDFVLTDPPFKVGKFFSRQDDIDLFLKSWYAPRYKEIYRILKNDKALLTECPSLYLSETIDCLRRLGFWYEYQIIFYTTNNIRRGKFGYSHYQAVLWLSKGKSKRRYNYPDVIKAPLKSNKKEFTFPTPKIVQHYRKAIDIFTSVSDIVFDPFLGSGTTVLAAQELGHNFIGIEIDPDYCKIAEKRLVQGVLSRRSFHAPNEGTREEDQKAIDESQSSGRN